MDTTKISAVRRSAIAAVGLIVGFVTASGAQTLSGRAYGAYVNTPLGSGGQAPLAVLPAISGTDGGIATAQADAFSVAGALSADFLNSATSGARGSAESGAQSVATTGATSILGGIIQAGSITAMATSVRGASGATSNSNGSSIEDLVVAGMPVTTGDGTVAPNTRMELPNVGYVLLNEQIPSGDGATSSGLTVNMIHVVMQSPILGLFGQIIGWQQTGEIIVGSATSTVGQ